MKICQMGVLGEDGVCYSDPTWKWEQLVVVEEEEEEEEEKEEVHYPMNGSE